MKLQENTQRHISLIVLPKRTVDKIKKPMNVLFNRRLLNDKRKI